MNALQQQSFTHQMIAARFTPEAKQEIGAEDWFLIVDNTRAPIIVTETGALCRLSISFAHTVNGTLIIEEEFSMDFDTRARVLHAITAAQRARLYTMRRASTNAKLRKSLRRQLYALRSARDWYDQFVSEAEPIKL